VTKAPFNEVVLGRVLVPWLRDTGWEVYQEIQVHAYGHVLDIAATRGRLVWAIEIKLCFTWALLDQADRWTRSANYVSVAVPSRAGISGIRRRVLDLLGIGCLGVDAAFGWVRELAPPALRRKIATGLRASLREEHKTWAEAGNADSHRYSPFQATCKAVREYVSSRAGCTMKELVDNVPTHYESTATARNCLAKWIGQGAVHGIEARREGRRVTLHPAAAES